MTTCPESGFVQDYLEGELPEEQARPFRVHLERCERCAGEVALYRRAFACLDRLPLLTPSVALTDRILDRVVPSRVRRRWVATVGWSYAAAVAACAAAVMVWVSQPGASALAVKAISEMSSRLVDGVVLGLNVLSFAILSLGQGWGVVTSTGERFLPLARALATPFATPIVLTSLGAAVVSCTALLWWLRPREKRSRRSVRPVGVLGF